MRKRSRVLTLQGTRYTIMERKGANGYVGFLFLFLFFFRTDLIRALSIPALLF